MPVRNRSSVCFRNLSLPANQASSSLSLSASSTCPEYVTGSTEGSPTSSFVALSDEEKALSFAKVSASRERVRPLFALCCCRNVSEGDNSCRAAATASRLLSSEARAACAGLEDGAETVGRNERAKARRACLASSRLASSACC